MPKTVLALALMLLGGAGLAGLALAIPEQEAWEAPSEAKAMKNPLAASDDVLAKGLDLYKKNCLMCHGELGKGDGPATKFVKPAPADITVPEKQARWTDGEIFWKVTEGKKPMPSFGKKLSEEERWSLVHYVRSLKGK
jgi:mono/diheme cytochrome c family protein